LRLLVWCLQFCGLCQRPGIHHQRGPDPGPCAPPLLRVRRGSSGAAATWT
jgi:hypothetical protein